MTLYIDTHLNEIDLALINNKKIVDRITKSNIMHTEVSVSSIKELLDSNNVNISDINDIIVINGPGSFTGVRIGVVIAKIMGYSLSIPVKSISYLQAVSLSYNEIKVALQEKNGAFIGEFLSDHSLAGEYYYLKLDDWNKENKEDYIIDKKIDILKVSDFLEGKESEDIHLLAPLYIKKIEVSK